MDPKHNQTKPNKTLSILYVMHFFNVLYTSTELQSREVVIDNAIVAINRIRWMKAKPIDVLNVRSARGQEE